MKCKSQGDKIIDRLENGISKKAKATLKKKAGLVQKEVSLDDEQEPSEEPPVLEAEKTGDEVPPEPVAFEEDKSDRRIIAEDDDESGKMSADDEADVAEPAKNKTASVQKASDLFASKRRQEAPATNTTASSKSSLAADVSK